jgi:hypothetical protein
MKILDSSPIAPGIAFIPKGGTLAFLQFAYQEVIAEMMTSKIGSSYDATKGYILNGCINSGSGVNYNISAGSIFFNGEIFLVDNDVFTISGSNVAVGAIAITQYVADADPSTFTDAVQRNVHNIRKIVFAPALAGSGAANFADLINLAYRPVGGIGQTILWTMPGSGSQNSLLPTYFDPGTGDGIHALTLGWQIDPLYMGFVPAGYSGVAPYNTIGQQQGANTKTIAATDLPELETDQLFSGAGGGGLQAYSAPSTSSTKITMNVNAGSPNNPISLLQPTATGLYIKRIS